MWLLQFAGSGDPGQGAQQWNREDKWYSKITTSVQQVLHSRSIGNNYEELDVGEGQPGFPHQAKDYHLSYHFASEGGDLTTTTAAPVNSSSFVNSHIFSVFSKYYHSKQHQGDDEKKFSHLCRSTFVLSTRLVGVPRTGRRWK